MEEESVISPAQAGEQDAGVQVLIRQAIQQFISEQQARAEPAYKAELVEERRRREALERRLNDLAEENRRARERAEETERHAVIRAELQKLGVSKVELAFRAVKDDVLRTEDGRLAARGDEGDMSLREYLQQFVNENPELLPARIPGGSGAGAGQRPAAASGSVDLERIRPGMSAEELERARQEIARIATQSLRGQ